METPAPGSPDWPCRTEISEWQPPRLVATLYLLLRDHVHPGDMEQVLLNISDHGDDVSYTNPALEELARAHATFLVADEAQVDGMGVGA